MAEMDKSSAIGLRYWFSCVLVMIYHQYLKKSITHFLVPFLS